jgi:hypothetical protein
MICGRVARDGRESPLSYGIDLLALLTLSLVIAILWLPRADGPLDLRWDGSVYYVLGTSIAEGQGYRLLNEPGDIQAIQYPPLLPALVAAHQLVLGTSDPVVVGTGLKRTYVLFHAWLTITSYFMFRTFFARWLSFAGAVAILLNVQTVFHSNLLFAEIPFALVTVLFVLCNRPGRTGVYRASAAVLAVTAFLLRTAGLALFAAWVVESLVQKRFRQAAMRLLIAAIPFVGWNAYVLHVERSPSYNSPEYPYQRAPYLNYNVSYATNLALVDAFNPDSALATAPELARRFWINLRGMVIVLGEAVSDSQGFWQYHLKAHHAIPLIVLGTFVISGIYFLIRQKEVFIPVYITTSVLLLCLTPWPEQFRRYLTPMLPFLLVSLFSGTLAASKRIRMVRSDLVRLLAPVPLAVVLIPIAYAETNALRSMYRWNLDPVTSETRDGMPVDYRVFYYAEDSKALDDALDWLQARTRSEDVVAMATPHWAYLRNQLKAVRPPLESDRERAQAFLDAVPVRYLLLKSEGDMQFVNDEMVPLVEGNPEAWKLVYGEADGLVRIYERVRPDEERR